MIIFKSKFKFDILYAFTMGFPGGTVVKNQPAYIGDTWDVGLIPGSGRSSGVRNATHCSILWLYIKLIGVFKLQCTEDFGRLQSMETQSWTRLSNWTPTDTQCLCLYLPWDILTTLYPAVSAPFWSLDRWVSQLAQWIKNLLTNAGGARDVGLIPESGRSPGGGNKCPLQYSWLKYPMDTPAW